MHRKSGSHSEKVKSVRAGRYFQQGREKDSDSCFKTLTKFEAKLSTGLVLKGHQSLS